MTYRLPLARRRWQLVVLGIVAAAIGLAALPATAAPPVPRANWSPCYRSTGFPFECTTVQVPLDHAAPRGAAISIAVVRLPATDPARRIGSLFFNPGGPGGSGVDFVLQLGPYLYSNEVRARFDMVGFDPRGVYRSTALRCFGTTRQWWFAPFPFPTSGEEEAIWEATDRYLVEACDQRAGRIEDHMSTADVARDLDLLRQAVGDEALNYVGYSYGSYLGVTYASLFPTRFRALVIDGILDPIAWSTGVPGDGGNVPFSTRLKSAQGARATLGEFFRLCDTGTCAFAPDAEQRFADLAARLQAEPVVITTADGGTVVFTYANLVSNALGAMYNPFSWPSFANFLTGLESLATTAAERGARLHAFWRDAGFITKRGAPRYPNYAEAFPGVACADSDNPDTYEAWSALAAMPVAGEEYFRPLWTWISSVCATWHGGQASRFTGPFTPSTAAPVLVLNTYFDPATRYEGAVAVNGLIGNSRLVSVNGWGHTTLFLSACADQAVSDYLVNGALPPEGTVCEQDSVPFIDFTAAPTRAAAAASKRQKAAGMMVPDAVRSVLR